MSASPPPYDLDDVAPLPVLPGPGEQLRTAREAAGMSVHEISTHMRLDSSVILALESDDYDALPAPTFIRGYLRGYARLLDISPESIIQAFEQRDFAPPSLVADIAVRSQIRSGDFPIRIVTYIVVAALVVLVVLWWRSQDFAPMRSDAGIGDDAAVSGEEPAAAALEPAAPVPEASALAEEPVASVSEAVLPPEEAPVTLAQAPAPSADAGAAASEGETPAAGTAEEAPAGQAAIDGEAAIIATQSDAAAPAAPEDALGAAAEAAPEAGSEDAAAAAPVGEDDATEASPESEVARSPALPAAGDAAPLDAGAPADRIDMSFVDECWLEVYDDTDDRLFYGLAQAGERVSLSGQGPIRVVMGNSEEVEVRYNGTPVEFVSFVTRGVARFSVGGDPPEAFRTPPPEPAGVIEADAREGTEPASAGG